jgi:L-asparaginase/Glu-tRNA(Gln) amidotransferase subunit D
MDAIVDVVRDTPVLVTTGTPAGSALRATYSGPGSERALAAAGVIMGWSLGARKAALALSLCLGQTTDRVTLHKLLENDMEGARR